MSEKRFECVFKEHETKNSWSMIKDNQLDRPLYIKDVVGLLNEQQATISHLEKVNGKNFAKRRLLEQDNLVLRNENEQLKEELNNLKKDETRLYHYYTLARYGGDGV